MADAEKPVENGRTIRWLLYSNLHQIKKIERDLDSMVAKLAEFPPKKFQQLIDDAHSNLLNSGTNELEQFFHENLCEFFVAMQGIGGLYKRLEKAPILKSRSIVRKKVRLSKNPKMRRLKMAAKGLLELAGALLVTCSHIIESAKRIKVSTISHVGLAEGFLKKGLFTGSLSFPSSLGQEEAVSLVESALDAGFPKNKLCVAKSLGISISEVEDGFIVEY